MTKQAMRKLVKDGNPVQLKSFMSSESFVGTPIEQHEYWVRVKIGDSTKLFSTHELSVVRND